MTPTAQSGARGPKVKKWTGLAVRLTARELVKDAGATARAQSRSVGKQIEHWARIGRLAELNPELPLPFINKVLIGLEQKAAGEFEAIDIYEKSGC